MTIETASAQNTSRPATTESKHAKGKPGGAHGHGSGDAGGFTAVLASLGASEPAASTVVEEALPGKGAVDSALKGMFGAKDVAALGDLADDQDLTAVEVDVDKLLMGGGTDLTDILPAPADPHLPPEMSLDASALLAQAAQWSAAPVANTEQANPDAVAGVVANLAGRSKLPFSPAKLETTGLNGVATGAAATTELADKVGKSQKDAFARLAAMQAALSAPTDASSPTADPRQTQVLQKMTEVPLNPIATALAAVNAVAPARREDMTRERSVFRSNASENVPPSQTYTPSVTGTSAASAPQAVSSTDTYVAEKVAYWISNDVQNAEMKLDGIGDQPVEVSIRMQGNEAHIAFRSDELQARAALENASQHLKDMLQREGLVLSGVSVGTAGTGDSADQERQSRQGARQSRVVSVQPGQAERVAGFGRSSGGALDLFV